MKQARKSKSEQVREGEGDRERDRTQECLEQAGGLKEGEGGKLVWKRAGQNEALVSAHVIS